MNWRPRSSTVSGATRGALATETEAMELVNDAGDVVASFSEDVDGNVSMEVDGQPKVYRALLTQSSTDAPVATVLENTLGGELVWTYADVGQYVATLAEAFTADKTAVNISALPGLAMGVRGDANEVLLNTFWAADDSPRNGVLTSTFVQILVYP